jgi:hypothetical protein
LTFNWEINEKETTNFESLTLYVPGILNRIIDFVGETRHVLTGLYPSSEYEMTMVLQSKEGGSKTYRLVGKTEGAMVLGESVDLRSTLIGRSWTNRPL